MQTDNNTQDSTEDNAVDLLSEPLEVISLGLEGFASELAEQQVPVTHLEWSPPAGGDVQLAEILSKLGA